MEKRGGTSQKSRTIRDSFRPCHYLMIRRGQRINAQPCRRAMSIASALVWRAFSTSACTQKPFARLLFQLVIPWDIGLGSDPAAWFPDAH
jgi:hypothetical protein